MQRLITVSTRRDWSRAELLGVGIFGCLLALFLGIATSAHRGTLIIGGIGAIALGAGAIVLYSRDPVLAFVWLWLFEIFDSPISAAAGYFSPTGEAIRQADELLVLLLVSLTVWRTARSNIRMPPLWVVLPLVGIAICGLIGAAFYSAPITSTLVGAWLGLKLWTILFVTFLLPWKPSDMTRVYAILVRIGLFVAAFGVVDYLTHAALSTALHTSIYTFQEGSARGEAVHSIFPHPGEFSLFMSILFALTFTRFATTKRKSDLIYALCFAGSVMLSLRLKGFLSLAAVVAIVTVAQGTTNRRGLALTLAMGALLLGAFYSIEGNLINQQIATYTSSESSARAKLYTTGVRIARDNFPLGVGFGRFATYASRIYYSPVYLQYGLNNVWGLSRKYPQFLDDTSWPGVIGETGWAGFLIYLAGIVGLIVALIRRTRRTSVDLRWIPLAALSTVAVLLADSLGDPTLFDWLAVTSFALIAGPAFVATQSNRPLHQPG